MNKEKQNEFGIYYGPEIGVIGVMFGRIGVEETSSFEGPFGGVPLIARVSCGGDILSSVKPGL